MKTSVTLIAIFLIFASPPPGLADYIIQLKNGKQIPIEYYWEEGNRIMVETAGGVMGIRKGTIAKIEESASTSKRNVIPRDVSADRPVREATAPSDKKQPSDHKGEATTPAPSERREKADEFLAEFKPLKARFKKVEILRTSELYDLAKENARFRRRVFKTNATTLLNDMLIESYAMDHKIEEIIKARGR
jgi:hypothetical protein